MSPTKVPSFTGNQSGSKGLFSCQVCDAAFSAIGSLPYYRLRDDMMWQLLDCSYEKAVESKE